MVHKLFNIYTKL